MTSEGRLKIGDFGMASIWPRPVLTHGANTTGRASFEREGDKLYLAPEVLQGRYGKAADIFRLVHVFKRGCVNALTCHFSLGMTMLETATNIIVPDQ